MRVLLSVLLLCGAAAHAQPLADPAMEREARRIHESVITLDTHIDIPLDYATAAADPGGFTTLQADLPKMRIGGLDAAFFIVYIPQGPLTDDGYAAGLRIAETRLDAIHRLVAGYPAEIGLALSAADVRRIHREGRKVALIGMENAFPLGPGAPDIDRWAAAGVRYMGITHFGHNQFADSSNPNENLGDAEERHGGLSALGRDLVSELNRHGIMVDVSHTGKKTMMQAAALSAAPIIASHSGVKAIADSPRNLDDEQLKALAASGGVVQIVALDVYVKPLTAAQEARRDAIRSEMNLETSEARAAMDDATRAEYQARIETIWEIEPRATVSDLVDHIDHAVKVAGIDHVGISSDFDGGGGVVGWADASETLNVTRELVRRGYSEREIAKIWSGNLLRVLEEAGKTARRMN